MSRPGDVIGEGHKAPVDAGEWITTEEVHSKLLEQGIEYLEEVKTADLEPEWRAGRDSPGWQTTLCTRRKEAARDLTDSCQALVG